MAEGEVREGLDPEALERLRRLGGNDLVRRMGELFLAVGEDRRAAARAGLESGDLESLERAAHSLKSSAGNMGAATLMERAGDLERAAEEARAAGASRPAGLAQRLRSVEEAFERAAEAVRRELERIE